MGLSEGCVGTRGRQLHPGQTRRRMERPTGKEPEFPTIGLIGESMFNILTLLVINNIISGQPNVGKSSLLNALFGTHKVRASKTPGKVSLSLELSIININRCADEALPNALWTPDIRLVDCPDLRNAEFCTDGNAGECTFFCLLPSYVQLSESTRRRFCRGSFRSHVSLQSLHASTTLPSTYLSNVPFRSPTLPSLALATVEDKRTWRGVGTARCCSKGEGEGLVDLDRYGHTHSLCR